MSKIIAILSADWHIAPGAWRHRGIVGDAYCSLGQVVDLAVEHGAAVIAAGDLFDVDDPDPQSVGVVTSALDRLEAAGCPFYFIAGQHEYHRLGRWLSVHRWATHLDRDPPHELAGGVKVYGIDWTPPGDLPAKLAAAPADVDLLVLHQVWSELMGGTLGVAEGNLADVPGDATILTGDYHKVSEVFAAGNHRVLSPGPIAMQAADEPAEKYCWLLTEEGDLVAHRLATRPCIRLKLYTDDAVAAAVAAAPGILGNPDYATLPEAIRTPLVIVEFPERLQSTPNAIRAAFPDCHHFFQPRREATEQAASASKKGRAGGLIENLPEMVKQDSPTYRRLRRLLEAQQPAEELRALKEEFFV